MLSILENRLGYTVSYNPALGEHGTFVKIGQRSRPRVARILSRIEAQAPRLHPVTQRSWAVSIATRVAKRALARQAS